jgi:ABC-2 type transport system permease protein
MKKSLFIMLKEVRDFLSDKGDLSFSILLPVLIFALMYGAFGNSFHINTTAYIVNEDPNGQYSNLLLQHLENYDGLTVQQLSASDADTKLLRSAILMAAFIPPDFSTSLASSQPARIIFKQRGNGGTEGQIAASLIQGAADEIAQGLKVQNQVKSDLASSNIHPQQIELVVQQVLSEEEQSPSVAIVETPVGSQPDPVNQYLPGIMTMFVLFAVNLTAQALVAERQKGTLERLLSTSLKVSELFAGKFLAYMGRGFIPTTILLLLAYAVFRIFTPFSFLEALVLALIFAAACSTIGLIIGSLSKTQNQATWISVFFTMLMVMLSGTFMPATEGSLLDTLSRFSINTYANDAFRILISQGGSLADARADILVMVGVAAVGLVLARFLFRATQGGK